MTNEEIKALIIQHQDLIREREGLVAKRASLLADVIDIDARLERLHRKIDNELSKMDPEHITIELPTGF